MAKTDLVIVESPAKARTIEKYLGSKYKVIASKGHLRDLPKSKMGVDLENGFIPDYQPIKGKEEMIDELKRMAGKSERVYLATDPDREGEAISWHIKELLEIPDNQALRVTFNEITKKVVQESINHPREIDMNLVDAQQARRILDRIVGYKISPLLWKKVKRGISAGRVQSAATRIVTEREEEIRAFKPEEYWLLDVLLECMDKKGSFTARFYGENGKKKELNSEEEVKKVKEAASKEPFVIKTIKKTDRQRSPSPPFITSTLQQEASRKLGMTPKRTMAIAQQLYEGVDISGEGTVGLITYMRTDSLRISQEALDAARELIVQKYGPAYHPGTPRQFKNKNSAQDAHETIRPSNVNLTPELVRKDLTNEQYRLYRLIWSRFISCQMSNAVYDSVVIDSVSAGYMFRANHLSLKFAGFTAVYEEGHDEESEERSVNLPPLNEGEQLSAKKFTEAQKFTTPPQRYTEATLIRAMEEKGIGRPSTYAPTISTITDRQYVIKEGKYLKPTPLGEVVTQLMCDKFSDIVDPKFTARMEETLDGVEEGKSQWKQVLSEFYVNFENDLEEAEKALDGVRIKIPAEETDEICDVCGKKMVIKSGRFGRFLACSGYPECTFTKPLVIEMPGKCPKCGSRILKRTSKKGYTFYACERGADCGFMTWDVPVQENCPECGQTMFKKSGRGAKKPFCINENCGNFTPEEKRGGYRKKTETAESLPAADSAEMPAKKTEELPEKPVKADKKAGTSEEKAAKKPAAKKAASAKSGKTKAEE